MSYSYIFPPEMRPAWIAEAWTDQNGTIHGLDPRGPKAMLEEVVLTPAQLSQTLENLTALKIDRTGAAHQYDVLKEVFSVLWTTANASNLKNVRVPRHAFTSTQWDWVRMTHVGTDEVRNPAAETPAEVTRYHDLAGATAKQLETMHAHIAATVRGYGFPDLLSARDALLKELGDRADTLRRGYLVTNIPLKFDAWRIWLNEAEAHWRANQTPFKETPARTLGTYVARLLELDPNDRVSLHLENTEDSSDTIYLERDPDEIPPLGAKFRFIEVPS